MIVRYGTTSLTTTLDQVATGFSLPKLKVSYNDAATFTFRLHAPHHTRPIPYRSLIALEDDSYSEHPNRPLFLGHVWEIVPQGSNEIDYVCQDVTFRAKSEITIMSGPHGDSNVIPRLVFNSKIDNDDDYAFEYAHDSTVGEIIETIMTNAYNELLTNCQAAPLGGGVDAFKATDLSPMDFIPQEKMVFESDRLGSGLSRLLGYYPQYRILFVPGYQTTENQWRFVKPLDGDEVTLTLNDFSGSKKVLSFGIKANLGDRWPAVRIYGPRQWVATTVYTADLSGLSGEVIGLTEEWDIFEATNFEANGPTSAGIGDAGKKWQISDATKRRISRLLPEELAVTDSQFNVAGVSYQSRITREPLLQATWDSTGAEWWTVPQIKIDYQNGIIETPVAVYQYNGPSDYKLPYSVRFVYAYFGDPLEVRYPSIGYDGTTYSVAGMQVEDRRYDEMLAVGYEKGSPITTVARKAQFEKLAESIHEFSKDIIYTGGCTLQGIDYDFIRLQKLINFAGVDQNGSSLTTGWEAAKAIVTDVEYDFDNDVTTLVFSSDYSAFLQTDVETLKRILKIRALQLVQILESTLDASGQTVTLTARLRNLLVDEGQVVTEY